ncbi:thioesterase II family protein [Salinispora mooreana]|uniref:thioesterase II family protein n=1 Tax=Salinispora mooreana TaxID=999545 RepID=UPI000477EDE7|nr:thioesterase domain-containing protein [Salinispora mooreana]
MTAGSAVRRSPWFLRNPSLERSARVFCFPYSGAGASTFHAWPTVIDDVEVCPLQFPGRENRMGETHYRTYGNLTADLIEPLAPHLDRPYAFFGHCSGALQAFETVLVLAAAGLRTPERLIVSGQVAPHDRGHDRMLTMSELELRAELESMARIRGIELRADMLDMGLAVLCRDRAAHAEYHRPEPAEVPCPITVLHWRDDPDVDYGRLKEWHRYSDSVDIHVIDGGRYGFLDAPEALTALLTGWRQA